LPVMDWADLTCDMNHIVVNKFPVLVVAVSRCDTAYAMEAAAADVAAVAEQAGVALLFPVVDASCDAVAALHLASAVDVMLVAAAVVVQHAVDDAMLVVVAVVDAEPADAGAMPVAVRAAVAELAVFA
jgi:hypothetical protein